MFKNINWKAALRRALEVFLAALLGSGGMYLSLSEDSDSTAVRDVVIALSPQSLG